MANWNQPKPTGEDRQIARIRNKKQAVASATTAAKETLGEDYSESRPEGVSAAMWDLAQTWIDTGTGSLGYRPRVSLAKFAKRFSDAVNNDEDLKNVTWITRATLTVKRIGGTWETPTSEHWHQAVHDMLSKMIELFWSSGRTGAPSVQFEFLDTEWDDLFFRAHSALKATRLLDNPSDYGVVPRITDMLAMSPQAAREYQEKAKNITVTKVAERLLNESKTDEYDRPDRDPDHLRKFNQEKTSE